MNKIQLNKEKIKQLIPRKPTAIIILVLVVLFGGIFGWNVLKAIFIARYFATYEPPPVTISAQAAQQETWEPFLTGVGNLGAANGVDVSPEVAGIIIKQNFNSGQMVKQGDLLVQLDDATDQQDLIDLQAQLKLAQITMDRMSELLKKRAAAANDVDQAQAKLQQAKANVGKTQIRIAQKAIRAPFAGKLGLSKINEGQYVTPGMPLVSLQSINELSVKFSLPEQNLMELYVGQPVKLTVDVYKNKSFDGKISAIDSQVNQQTHTILVQASVPNPKLELYPGLFADVHILLPQKEKVITVPQTAIIASLYGNSVYVVKEKGKDKKGNPILQATQQYVTTGQRRGDEIAIEKGIKAGDMVVTSGQLKLSEGSKVIINNSADMK